MRKTLFVSKEQFFHVHLCLGSTIRKKMSQLSQQLVEHFNITFYFIFLCVNANDITLPKIAYFMLIKNIFIFGIG